MEGEEPIWLATASLSSCDDITSEYREKERGKRAKLRMGSSFPAIFIWPLWEKTGRAEKSLYSQNEGGGDFLF